jgi:hypothetical protein
MVQTPQGAKSKTTVKHAGAWSEPLALHATEKPWVANLGWLARRCVAKHILPEAILPV